MFLTVKLINIGIIVVFYLCLNVFSIKPRLKRIINSYRTNTVKLRLIYGFLDLKVLKIKQLMLVLSNLPAYNLS